MSDAVLLDILFAIIGLLFVPIGVRRGVQREVFVTAGVLAGAQLADSWGRPWGGDLASQLDLRAGIGQFTVSALFLIGATLLLGYGGAAAVRPPDPSVLGRVSGGALAIINGALITAYLLRDLERFLTDPGTERALEKSRIAWTLLRQFGWVALGASLVMLVPILISLLRGERREPTVWSIPSSAEPWQDPAPQSARKPRLAWGNDEGKLEPVAREYDPAGGRYGADAPNLQQTIPIAPVDAHAWSVDRAQPIDRRAGEWLDVATRNHPEWSNQRMDSTATNGAHRCLGCGEPMGADDMFCPSCGRARGH